LTSPDFSFFFLSGIARKKKKEKKIPEGRMTVKNPELTMGLPNLRRRGSFLQRWDPFGRLQKSEWEIKFTSARDLLPTPKRQWIVHIEPPLIVHMCCSQGPEREERERKKKEKEKEKKKKKEN